MLNQTFLANSGSEEKSDGLALFGLHCSVVSPEANIVGENGLSSSDVDVIRRGRNSSDRSGGIDDIHVNESMQEISEFMIQV